MKNLLAISLLFLIGCGGVDQPMRPSHFYIKSQSNGYLVCIDATRNTTVCVSEPFTNPIDADILAKELNRDMEGHWEK